MRILIFALAFLTGSASARTPLEDLLVRAEAFGFDGQVVVARDGRVLLDGAYGLADRERGREVARDTVFGIASQSKSFTAAAILKLEAEGRLRVEDTIGRFLEGVPEDKKNITLHQLLTHTSGLPGGDVVPDFAEVTPDEVVRRILALERKEPGAWRYSNAGYTLLGAVIERASGQRYDRFLHDEIFGPAGMRNTGIIGVDRPRDAAVAYRGFLPQGGPATWKRNWRTWGGGDVYSTAGDLYRWDLALRGTRVLPEAQRAKLFVPYVKLPEAEEHYGYGWFVTPALVEHGGDTETGFHCAFRRYADGLTVIITGNRSEVNGIWQRWGIQEDIATAARAQEAPASGTYRSAEGGEVAALLWNAQPDAAKLAKASEKTMLLLEGIRTDPRQAFLAALTGEGEKYVDDYLEEWASLVREHGALRSVRLSGVVPRGQTARAFVELRFERGTVPITYIWRDRGEGRLAGSTPGEGPPLARVFAPIGRARFATRDSVELTVLSRDRIVVGGVSFERPK